MKHALLLVPLGLAVPAAAQTSLPPPSTIPPPTAAPITPLVPAPAMTSPAPVTAGGAAAPADDPGVVTLEGPADSAQVDANQNLTLEGNVRLRYRGYRIHCDRATFSNETRIATFEGHVVIETGQETFNGDYFAINQRTRAFETRNGSTILSPSALGSNIVEPLRISGKTLSRVSREIDATEGFLTTCDFPIPHYKVGFAQASVIPNRRIAMRDVVVYSYEKPVARLKYLSLPLTDDARNYSYLPQVGRNDEEGYFVKAAQGYVLGNLLPGILRVDLMQKKGIGLGFDQAYKFGAKAAGTLVLYSLRDRSRGVNSLSSRLNHQQKFGDWLIGIARDSQQNSYQTVASASTSKSQTTNLTATHSANGHSTSASLNLSQSDYGFGSSKNSSYIVTQTERLGLTGNVTLRLNGSEFDTTGSKRRDQTGELQAHTTAGIFDLDIAANKNLIHNASSGGYFSGTERLPEITLSTDSYRFARGWLKTLPLRLTTGYGKFIESGTTRKDTSRALLALDANPNPISLNHNLSLLLGGNFRQSVYSDNTAQYVLTSRSQLTQKLGGSSTWNFNYGYLRPYGFTPLISDQTGSFNNVGTNMTINGPRVRLTLFTGYDIQRAQSNDPLIPKNPWQNLAAQIAFRPSETFQTRFTSTYDLNYHRLKDLTNRIRIHTRSGFSLDTGTRYDPEQHKFPQINGNLQTPLVPGKWFLSAQTGYNGYTSRFEYKNFALVRNWHDYDLTFTYTDAGFNSFRRDKGFNFLFRLKAFPVYQRASVGQYGTALDTGTSDVF